MNIRTPKNKVNHFKPHLLPTTGQLYKKYGTSLGDGHPDNTDPYKFSDPVNPSGQHHLETMSAAERVVSSDSERYAQQKAAEAAAAKQAELDAYAAKKAEEAAAQAAKAAQAPTA